MDIGLIVVGDEILSGKRRDGHMPAVIERLSTRGLELTWAHFVGDDEARLTETLRATLAGNAVVFCCGGIGATPDDVTRQAAAAASGRRLLRHPEGEALLRSRFGTEASDLRLRMVDFPEGAELIPNPVNQIPGFRIADHHFVPGFPKMAWPMIEWALDAHYGSHFQAPRVARAVRVRARESDLIPLLEELGAEHPAVRLSSLPDMAGAHYVVELGVYGPVAEAETALTALQQRLTSDGVPRADDDNEPASESG